MSFLTPTHNSLMSIVYKYIDLPPTCYLFPPSEKEKREGEGRSEAPIPILSPLLFSHLPNIPILKKTLFLSSISSMSDAFCSDCKKNTEVVFDHSAGDMLCSECGLVLESHSIDETSEWRTFANESGDNDPVRVGGPSNPLLTDGGLSTVIAKPNGASGDFLSGSLGRWQNRSSNPDRSLILAFKTIATMSDRC